MLKLFQTFDHRKVACDFLGMRQSVIGQNERLRREFWQQEKRAAKDKAGELMPRR